MIKIRPLVYKEHKEDPPPPVGDYDYKITLYSTNSTFYVNTVCFNREQEGQGNCYSDPACTNELYDLEMWYDGSPNTQLFGEQDPLDPMYYVYNIYLKNVSLPQSYIGTIISANYAIDSTGDYYHWSWGIVYDINGNIVSQQINESQYAGEWVDINYTQHS